jgi:hypothetical protein
MRKTMSEKLSRGVIMKVIESLSLFSKKQFNSLSLNMEFLLSVGEKLQGDMKP